MEREALKLALEDICAAKLCEFNSMSSRQEMIRLMDSAITALRQAIEQAEQAQPVACPKCKGLGYYDEGHECDDGSMAGGNYVECERCKKPDFTKHEVENTYDWSNWVCPDPKGYLMKCCDCGLVHEAEFKVVRYKSETEREDCEPVDDPNVQAVFRMRRNEQWSPEDTAHRAGGLPMEQAQPVAWMYEQAKYGPTDLRGQQWHPVLSQHKPYTESGMVRGLTPLYNAPPPCQPLTDEQCDEAIRRSGLWTLACTVPQNLAMLRGLCREAAHGIKGEA